MKVGDGQFGIRSALRLAMPHSKFMKYPLPAVLLVTSVLMAGCNSLDNPFHGLFGTGHDARVYNSQTGQFEWPPDQKKPQPRGPAPAGGTPAPERAAEGRYFDVQKNQWVEVREEKTAASKSKKAASPPPLMTTPVPVGTPPPVRPPRARGVYNPSTGQIEWNDFDPAPAATPVPKKKSWYWPF